MSLQTKTNPGNIHTSGIFYTEAQVERCIRSEASRFELLDKIRQLKKRQFSDDDSLSIIDLCDIPASEEMYPSPEDSVLISVAKSNHNSKNRKFGVLLVRRYYHKRDVVILFEESLFERIFSMVEHFNYSISRESLVTVSVKRDDEDVFTREIRIKVLSISI